MAGLIGAIGLIGWAFSGSSGGGGGGGHRTGSAKSNGSIGAAGSGGSIGSGGAAAPGLAPTVGSGDSSSAGASSSSGAGASLPAAGPGAALGATAGTQASGASSGSAPGGIPNEVPSLPTKVIKTGAVSLQVPAGALTSVLGTVSQRAAALGGFVSASSQQTPTDSSPPGATVTLRLPVASFEGFVAFVEHQGTVVSVNSSGQDVTASYVDLQARITSLQDTRTQFEQILSRASTIGDILSVESQISDLQTQLEQLQGQLNVLDNQTSFSTLSLSITEKPKPGVVVHPKKPPSGLEKAWLHARHTFTSGVESVIGATGGIAVFLLFAGLLLLAGRFGWKAVRGRWAP